MEIEWTETALVELAAIDKSSGRRIKQTVERFAATGVGDVKKLRGIVPSEFRLRAGDHRVRFHLIPGGILIFHVRNRRDAYP